MEKNVKKKVKIRFKNKKAAVTAIALAVAVLVVICLAIWGIVSLASKSDSEVVTELHPDFTITTLSGSLDSTPNTISYIKNAATCGAQLIEVDLMFNSKGEPVMADKFDNIDMDTTVPLIKALDILKEYPDVGIVLDLHALTNLTRIEELAEKYNMFGRIYYSGVTPENYEYVMAKSPNIPFFLEIDVTAERPDHTEYFHYIRECAFHAYAVNVDFDDLDEEWAKYLFGDGHRISVYNISSNKEFTKALDWNVANIITDRPAELQTLVLDWIVARQNENA